MKRREFIKKAGIGAAAVAATAVNAPYVIAQQKSTIKWRLQTYAGPALAEHVIKPSIDAFNKAANGEMVIELSKKVLARNINEEDEKRFVASLVHEVKKEK